MRQLNIVLSLQYMGLLGPPSTLTRLATALGVTKEQARQRVLTGRHVLSALWELREKGLDASISCLRWFDPDGLRAIHALKGVSTLGEFARSRSPRGISRYVARCGPKTEQVLMRWWSALKEAGGPRE